MDNLRDILLTGIATQLKVILREISEKTEIPYEVLEEKYLRLLVVSDASNQTK